jgi:hypothetical protein
MRQVREVLCLKHVCGHNGHQIAAMAGVSRYTVAEYLRRAGVLGITWPVPAELDDAALERKLFTPLFAVGEPARPQPDWPRLHAELRRPGVTLLLVWEEYRAGQPDGPARRIPASAMMYFHSGILMHNCCGVDTHAPSRRARTGATTPSSSARSGRTRANTRTPRSTPRR